ncbi:TolC family protein [Rubritalea halochordaticola]
MLFLACASALLSTSCVSNKINTRLAEHAVTQRMESLDLGSKVFSAEQTPISWEKANQLILKRNLQYLSSLKSIESAERNRKNQWLSVLPDLYLFTSIGKSIDELSDFSKDDLETRIVSRINIPNPYTYYAQAYALGLNELQTRNSHELTRRQLQVTLYSLYLQSQRIEDMAKQADKLESELDRANLESLRAEHEKIKELRSRHLIARESLRLKLNKLFETPGQHWKLTGSPPKISYSKKLDSLDLRQGYGALGLKMQAIEIEYSIISLWNANLERLPKPNFNLSTPTLYSSESENNFSFNAEDFQLFTSLSKSIQIEDPLDKQRMRNAEFRSMVTRAQLRGRMESDASQIKVNKYRYRQLLNRRKQALADIQRIQNANISSSTSLLTAMKATTSLKDSIEAIDNQLLQLDLQFWIWDEKYWKKH